MLQSFILYFATLPIILPVWEKGPMPQDFLKYDNRGYKAETEKVDLQQEGLKVKDPVFKIQVLRRLSLLENEDAAKVMYNYLKVETEPVLREATLTYLYNCPPIPEQMKVVEGLINNQTSEGISAARLYCRFKGCDPAKVTSLLEGSTKANKVLLVQAIRGNKLLKPDSLLPLLKVDSSHTYQGEVLAAIAEQPLSGKAFDLIKNTLNNGSLIQKTAVASALHFDETSSTLLNQMSKDKHATVRIGSARGMGAMVSEKFEDTLIVLSQDKDAEVRKAACDSLRNYSSDKSIKALIKVLDDPQLLTQKKAVESLMHISKGKDIMPLVAPSLSAGTFSPRRWAAHIAGNLVKKEHAATIDQQLRKEKNFDARTEQVYALGQFKHKLDKDLITKLTKDHERVRAALMLYLAKIDVEEFFPLMHEAAMNDPVGPVRWAALEGAGINGSPWFNKTLLDIMLDLDEENMRDAQDRACACWAAGKIRGLSDKMFDQMQLSMNRPTIPVPMGPNTFDHSSVLISIVFACVDQSKKGGPNAERFGKYADAFVYRFVEDTRSVDFPRGYHNDFYANQAKYYLKNQKFEPKPFPKRKLSFEYKEVRK